MEVLYINDLKNIDINNEKSRNITIGFFDGVHIGHQHVINSLINNTTSSLKTVITFDYHPIKRLIMPLNEKIDTLNQFDIDEVFVIQMNNKIKETEEQEFIGFLNNININKIFIGPDFRFGQYAKGNVKLLQENFNVEVIDFIYQNNLKVSSSEIRRYLEEGNVKLIYEILGKYYSIKGAVVEGQQIGRTIDFPTANIITDFYIPKFGVYYTNVVVNNKKYKSVTNIGNRPTVGGHGVTIETHILDFNEQIYGKVIEVIFIDFIREEIKFNSLEELKIQIKKDRETVNKIRH